MAVVGEVKRVDGYGSGNELDGYNKIQAKNDARIKRNTRGFEIGILDMSFQGDTETRVPNAAESFQLTATTNQNITLGKGIATCYGFDLVVDGLILFDTISPPAVNEKYIFVYLEWNLANPDSNEFNVGTWDNGTGTTWTPAEQDNLANVPNGKYRLPLYRITISSNGNVTNTQNYATLGVQTYNGTQNTNYAQTALKYDNTNNTVDGSIAKKFKESDDKNTEYDASWKALEYVYGAATLLDITDSAAITKTGKMVFINATVSKTIAFSSLPSINSNIGSIPNGYRPKRTIYAKAVLFRTDNNLALEILCSISTAGVITYLSNIGGSTLTSAAAPTYIISMYNVVYEVA